MAQQKTEQKVISEALKNAIQTHGPIGYYWIGSAAKRIHAALKSWRKRSPRERDADLKSRAALYVIASLCKERGGEIRISYDTIDEVPHEPIISHYHDRENGCMVFQLKGKVEGDSDELVGYDIDTN